MKLRMNRFEERTVDVLYFLTEPRLNIAFAVVEEYGDQVKYYPVCIAPFLDAFQNTTVYRIAVNPVGENYDTGMPSIGSKSKLQKGIFGGHLDITKDIEEVSFILTGKRKPAFKTNVIG